jgi:hypothetical protein
MAVKYSSSDYHGLKRSIFVRRTSLFTAFKGIMDDACEIWYKEETLIC